MDTNAKKGRRVARQIIKVTGDGSGNTQGGYVLPSEGIPKSDLSPGVRQSLDRADAASGALTDHANNQDAHGLGGIRQAISDLESASPAPGGGYQPPQGGIPKTDLSQEVQGLLAKANTALQAVDKFSGEYGDLTSVPDTFPPSSHTHVLTDLSAQVQGLLSLAESAVQEESDPVYAADKPHIAKLSDLDPLATTAALNGEAQARLAADEALSDRIDAIAGGEFSGSYGDLADVPQSFPPSEHSHVLTDLSSQVQGLLSLAESALQEEEDPVYTADKPDIAMKADLTPLATTAALNTHAGDTDKHITAQERADWDGKADADAFNTHDGDNNRHITAQERSDWNAKLDASAQAADSAKLGGKAASEYQPAISATGAANLLTAPTAAGEQPGTKPVADFATPADVDAAQFAVNAPDYEHMESVNRITTQGGQWTADRDGFVFLQAGGDSLLSTFGTFTINGIAVHTVGTTIMGQACAAGSVYRVSKGDIIACTYNYLPVPIICKYIPPKKVPAPWSAEMAFIPDYSNIENTNYITTSGGSWTVLRDGFVRLLAQKRGTICPKFVINSVEVLPECDTGYGQPNGGLIALIYAVKRGDVIRIYGDSPGCNFIPPVAIVPPTINMDYSTNEIDTGKTYSDGKKIYRRVFTGTLPARTATSQYSLSTTLDTTAPYYDKIISVTGWYKYNNATAADINNQQSSVENALFFGTLNNPLYSGLQGTFSFISISLNSSGLLTISRNYLGNDLVNFNQPFEVCIEFTKV